MTPLLLLQVPQILLEDGRAIGQMPHRLVFDHSLDLRGITRDDGTGHQQQQLPGGPVEAVQRLALHYERSLIPVSDLRRATGRVYEDRTSNARVDRISAERFQRHFLFCDCLACHD